MRRTRGTEIILGAVLALCVSLEAAEPVLMPLATILADPTAFHRRPVVIHGVVSSLTMYERREILGREQCAQGFKLEDDTGAIDVVWTSWCQIGEEKAVHVGQGERVTVHATIEAPPGNLTDTQGSALGIKAVATKILR